MFWRLNPMPTAARSPTGSTSDSEDDVAPSSFPPDDSRKETSGNHFEIPFPVNSRSLGGQMFVATALSPLVAAGGQEKVCTSRSSPAKAVVQSASATPLLTFWGPNVNWNGKMTFVMGTLAPARMRFLLPSTSSSHCCTVMNRTPVEGGRSCALERKTSPPREDFCLCRTFRSIPSPVGNLMDVRSGRPVRTLNPRASAVSIAADVDAVVCSAGTADAASAACDGNGANARTDVKADANSAEKAADWMPIEACLLVVAVNSNDDELSAEPEL
mmetsp:Transcript_17660/g.49012  ORF Transcript_17660/g.49012 Transcript_17660/m.49012 type:complete len:272 (-) Transcript_17660:135-950(-)